MSVPNSPKTKRGANGKFLPKPLLFHLRHPNSKTNEPKFWQILSPKNCFAKTSSALKPHALPEYLEGRTPKEKHPFLFQKKFHPRQIRNARSVFSFGVAGVLASAWGFGSFFQFPLEKSSRKVYNYSTRSNSTIFSVDTNGRRKAPTKDFLAGLQGNSEFLARKRAVFFRQEAGAKSEAILTNFALPEIQKDFLLL